MATVTAPRTAPAEQRTLLYDVSWETYESLLADHIDRSAPRFTYDHGVLEIMSPGLAHEKANLALALIADVIAEERDIDVLSVGSMTWKRQDEQRGFEPDSSFYIQHEARMRERTEIDVSVDPPPDLVIEIDMTHSSIPKLPIFARMGVPEVWRFDGQRVTISRLVNDQYQAVQESAALPPATDADLTRLLMESGTRKRKALRNDVRAWVRSRS